MVQFYPWFKFLSLCFKLIIIYYHTQKERTKLNHNIDIFLSSAGTCALLNLIRVIRYILIVPHFNMWDFVRNGDQIF